MSYISARQNKKTESIEIVERVNGKRIFNSYPIDYGFYVDSPNGKYKTIYNTSVDKITPKSSSEFYKELAILKGKKLWESDLNLVQKCLSINYKGKPAPNLNICFVDIECAWDKARGFAPIEDPFNMITAITLKLEWLDQLVTLCVPPKTITFEKAQSIADKFDNTFVFQSEIEMLSTMLDLIEDADIISGWNSKGFDIPYTINRVARVMSKNDTRRFCLWNELPKATKEEMYGKEINTYDLVGRIHIDLLDLYRKYTYEERHSYSLNAIGEYELGESKTQYSGSLDELYNNDFETFIKYNRQDVILLSKLENKLKFIELLNAVAHETTTLLPTCLGTVSTVDQAIINRAHDLGMVVPNKGKYSSDTESIVGAYVAQPKAGIHEWVGVIDVNGLYPSALRAMNMGMETIVGQLRPIITDNYIQDKFKKSSNMTFSHSWEGMFNTLEYQAIMDQKNGVDVIIDWEESGLSDTITAKQCYDLIFNSDKKWMLSANGTIFTYEREAIIPGLLSDWTKTRKEYQKKKAEATDPEQAKYYDRLQHTRKILSNSLYGAINNSASRFNDRRVGQSITLSGRTICKHMNSFVNECITGKYDVDGDAIIAVDTDSSQFSAWSTMKPLVESGQAEWNKEIAVQLYLAIEDKVNESFQPFMAKSFNCPEKYGSLIKSSCESVGYRAIYMTKKRYAILNYFKDGKWYDDEHLKLKAMGLDLRRSDTPEICQEFLTEILLDLLKNGSEEVLIKKINDFRIKFKNLPLWEQGTPKRVNNLTMYTEQVKSGKGSRVPGHARAAINWNNLREINSDNVHTRITDGMKCIVVQLKNNILGMTSVAYPIDEPHLPDWFTRLPIDSDSQVESLVDKKVENLLSKLPNWEKIRLATQQHSTFNDFFS
jgi:DNA polymerase elongation subunit (family B)